MSASAGDHGTISIFQAVPSSPGQEVRDWRTVPRGKDVRLLDISSIRTLSGGNEPPVQHMIFRIAHTPGVIAGDWVHFQSLRLVVRTVTEGMRGSQLELRCETLTDSGPSPA